MINTVHGEVASVLGIGAFHLQYAVSCNSMHAHAPSHASQHRHPRLFVSAKHHGTGSKHLRTLADHLHHFHKVITELES